MLRIFGLAAALWLGGSLAGGCFGLSVPFADFPEVLERGATPSGTYELLVNNSLVVLIASAGILTFGATALLASVSSGFMFGFVLVRLVLCDLPPSQVLLIFLPHLPLELPALFLACSFGLAGITKTAGLFTSGELPVSGLKTILAAEILMVIACIVEGEVSFRIAEAFS